jgi:hypothetical protein
MYLFQRRSSQDGTVLFIVKPAAEKVSFKRHGGTIVMQEREEYTPLSMYCKYGNFTNCRNPDSNRESCGWIWMVTRDGDGLVLYTRYLVSGRMVNQNKV